MGDQPEPEQSGADALTWREPLVAFVVVVVALAAASGLSMAWPPLAGYLLAVAAALFIGVPYFILRRRGADFHRFGIDLERIPLRHVGIGLLVSAVVFPLYAIGHHLWETSVVEREFDFSMDNYRQWSVDLDAPNLVVHKDDAIQLRTVGNRLHLEWTTADRRDVAVFAAADHRFVWDHAGPVAAVHADEDAFNELPTPTHAPLFTDVDPTPATHWYLTVTAAQTDARFVLTGQTQPEDARLPTRLTLRISIPEDVPSPEVYVGSGPQDADDPIELRRTHWWLILWGLTHLLVVALPEEYFYRGYLQTRLHDLLGHSDTDQPRTFLGFSHANWLTSALFALGHVLIPIGGVFSLARGAVFFPSLIFGWLRDRTGSIIAPIIFHAAANMMVLIVAVHYF